MRSKNRTSCTPYERIKENSGSIVQPQLNWFSLQLVENREGSTRFSWKGDLGIEREHFSYSNWTCDGFFVFKLNWIRPTSHDALKRGSLLCISQSTAAPPPALAHLSGMWNKQCTSQRSKRTTPSVSYFYRRLGSGNNIIKRIFGGIMEIQSLLSGPVV